MNIVPTVTQKRTATIHIKSWCTRCSFKRRNLSIATFTGTWMASFWSLCSCCISVGVYSIYQRSLPRYLLCEELWMFSISRMQVVASSFNVGSEFLLQIRCSWIILCQQVYWTADTRFSVTNLRISSCPDLRKFNTFSRTKTGDSGTSDFSPAHCWFSSAGRWTYIVLNVFLWKREWHVRVTCDRLGDQTNENWFSMTNSVRKTISLESL